MAVVVGSLAIDEPAVIDKRADTTAHTTTEGTVQREVVSIGDPDNTRTANRVACLTATPAGGDVGMVTRNIPSGTQPISGTVTANAGTNLDTSALALDATLGGDLSLDQSHTRNEGFKESAAIGAEMDETTPVLATEGNVSPARMDANRSLYAQLRTGTGETGVVGTPLRTDPTGVTTQPVSGTVTADAGTSPASTAGWRMQIEDSGTGDRAAVTAAGDLKITTDGESVLVNAPVATPVFVRQSDGAAAIDPRDINDFVGRTIRSAVIDDAASGENNIVALVATRRIKVFAINLSATGAVNVKWLDGTAGSDMTGDTNLEAREGYTIAVTPPAFLFGTSAGNALILNLSAAVGCKGWVSYWDDDLT